MACVLIHLNDWIIFHNKECLITFYSITPLFVACLFLQNSCHEYPQVGPSCQGAYSTVEETDIATQKGQYVRRFWVGCASQHTTQTSACSKERGAPLRIC